MRFVHELEWKQDVEHWISKEQIVHLPNFAGAQYSSTYPALPLFSESFPLAGAGQLEVTLINLRYEKIRLKDNPDLEGIGTEITPGAQVAQDRHDYIGKYFFHPDPEDGECV